MFHNSACKLKEGYSSVSMATVTMSLCSKWGGWENFNHPSSVYVQKICTKFLTPTDARKVGATEHARQGCSYSEAASLSRHMGHSMATSRKYYQATVSKSDSINAFERIKALGKEKRTTEQPRKRRQWSEAQTALIHTYFHAAIEGGLTISLEEARQPSSMDRLKV